MEINKKLGHKLPNHKINKYLFISATKCNNSIEISYLLKKNGFLLDHYLPDVFTYTKRLCFILENNVKLNVIIVSDLYLPNENYKLLKCIFDMNCNYVKLFLNEPGVNYEINGNVYKVKLNHINSITNTLSNIKI